MHWITQIPALSNTAVAPPCASVKSTCSRLPRAVRNCTAIPATGRPLLNTRTGSESPSLRSVGSRRGTNSRANPIGSSHPLAPAVGSPTRTNVLENRDRSSCQRPRPGSFCHENLTEGSAFISRKYDSTASGLISIRSGLRLTLTATTSGAASAAENRNGSPARSMSTRSPACPESANQRALITFSPLNVVFQAGNSSEVTK